MQEWLNHKFLLLQIKAQRHSIDYKREIKGFMFLWRIMYISIAPYLNKEERKWLQDQTRVYVGAVRIMGVPKTTCILKKGGTYL